MAPGVLAERSQALLRPKKINKNSKKGSGFVPRPGKHEKLFFSSSTGRVLPTISKLELTATTLLQRHSFMWATIVTQDHCLEYAFVGHEFKCRRFDGIVCFPNTLFVTGSNFFLFYKNLSLELMQVEYFL